MTHELAENHADAEKECACISSGFEQYYFL